MLDVDEYVHLWCHLKHVVTGGTGGAEPTPTDRQAALKEWEFDAQVPVQFRFLGSPSEIANALSGR